MLAHPFDKTSLSLTARQQRSLALVGVYQGAYIAHLLAFGMQPKQDIAHDAMLLMIKSFLNYQFQNPQPAEPLHYIDNLSDVSMGLFALQNSLNQPFRPPQPNSKIPPVQQSYYPTTYALSLLQLQRKIYKNPTFLAKFQHTQQQILRQLSFFEYDYLHPSIIANLAQLYSETASTLTPKIMVKGKIDALKNQQQANKIRAMLITTLPYAHMWRQLGGNSWQFIFGKSKTLQDVRELVQLQYQQGSN
ncbi:DUF489 family protein [Acinetobacter sp. c1-l78]|uniref:DUF489 family protein n=1 Tax=Acinetobacter sp. c1-l78 TaxID=3342803 RepID=UPI0035B6F959